ncbi:hypothetical protein YC2023_032632 [Brassica napus]
MKLKKSKFGLKNHKTDLTNWTFNSSKASPERKAQWCSQGCVDNVYGDRRLVSTLLPEEEQVAAAVSA